MSAVDPKIFKAYDIRGIYPSEINEELAYGIAQAYAKFLNPKTVALGFDVRTSSPALFEAAKQGLVDHGVNVVDIGMISTDMLYFAVANYGYDGGIIISASHNPKEYNGMKLTREQAIPISGDTGIGDIKNSVIMGYEYKADQPGTVSSKNIADDYIKKCLSFVDVAKISAKGGSASGGKPLKVVANAMFGLALTQVAHMNLPVKLIELNENPDGNFPKGQPDPLQVQNQQETKEVIQKEHPDLGVAWDADADRCFFFDENGRFLPPYYVSAVLSEYFCKREPGATIVHDIRLRWAIEDKVKASGGKTMAIKAGRAYFNPEMRKDNAVFASETSGHYYFRDYFSSDNGLIPFLIMLEIVSQAGVRVSELFDEYFENYPVSGEINTKASDLEQVKPLLEKIEQHFAADPKVKLDKTDGISIEGQDWRANIRGSNTEPLIRTNVEAKNPKVLLSATEEVLRFIG
ncbi:MAG TPA: phosphomannomutase/phosphoglucomutase [Patescibacteria group bacterium]|nr:phosphomannomutase/phosphoglucomutase [Patescibacteria group bacterium]